MSEAGELRDVCDELLGSLDAAIAMVERIAAEGLGVAALMRVHRASRIGARRLLAGLPELSVRDDDTEDLLQGFSGRAGAFAPTDAAIDGPMPVAQATPARVELRDDDEGDEDDTAQGALREQLRQLREAIGDEHDYERFLEAFRTVATPQDQLRYLYALAEFPTAELVQRTCELAMSGEVRTQNAPFVLNRCVANRDHGEQAWGFVRRHWEQANERFPENTIIYMIDSVKLLTGDAVSADFVPERG